MVCLCVVVVTGEEKKGVKKYMENKIFSISKFQLVSFYFSYLWFTEHSFISKCLLSFYIEIYCRLVFFPIQQMNSSNSLQFQTFKKKSSLIALNINHSIKKADWFSYFHLLYMLKLKPKKRGYFFPLFKVESIFADQSNLIRF